MRITKRSNIAMRVLMFCAINKERLVTKGEVAARCNVSESHLAQIINKLSQLGYLDTQRGRNGGVTLSRPANQIVVGEVFRILEDDTPLAECFADSDNTCPLTSACRLRLIISEAMDSFFSHLDDVCLDELVCDNAELVEILSPLACSKADRHTI